MLSKISLKSGKQIMFPEMLRLAFLINQYEWHRVNGKGRYKMEVKEIGKISLFRAKYFNFIFSVREFFGGF